MIFSIICAVVSVLEKSGVTDWGKIYGYAEIVDGIKPTDSEFQIHYLNVGQSDCTLVICNNHTLIIDTGTYHQIDEIYNTLRTLGIQKIDYIVITHQHDDHMGSAASIIRDYPVDNIIMPKLSEINMVTTLEYEELLTVISQREVTAIPAEPGLDFQLGDANVHFYAPLKQDKNINNMSAVLKITYGETSFLFQGDAEKKVENALLNTEEDLSADVIKLGHHGSSTSSTDKYIKAVAPKIAIASCGYNNDYGHPNKNTLKTLNKYEVDIFVTFICGDISVFSDGKIIKLMTEYSDEVLIYE